MCPDHNVTVSGQRKLDQGKSLTVPAISFADSAKCRSKLDAKID